MKRQRTIIAKPEGSKKNEMAVSGKKERIATDVAGLMKSKNHAGLIAHSKVVYSRDGDSAESIVLRDVSRQVESCYSAFGVSGKEAIAKIFYAVLSLVNESAMEPYLTDTWYLEGIMKATAKFADRIHPKHGITEPEGTVTVKSGKGVTVQANGSRFNVTITLNEKYATIGLYNVDDIHVDNGIMLFLSEAISLLKYLNTRFQFEPETRELLLRPKKEIALDDDNFF